MPTAAFYVLWFFLEHEVESWGGVVGWGGDVHVLRTCAHILVHASMLDAMHLLQIHASSANQDACVFLVNMLDATPLMGWSGGVGWECSRSWNMRTYSCAHKHA